MPAAHLSGPPIHPYYAAGCTEKIAFDSRADARKAARKHAGSAEQYQCGKCGAWHNTRQGKLPPKVTT